MILRKHVKNTDVAMEILSADFVNDLNAIEVKVNWWNIVRPHRAFPLNIVTKHRIPLEAWSNWKRVKVGVAA